MITKVLKNSNVLVGVTESQTRLADKKNRTRKNLMFSLSLTSLIDAFSILVIFLLSQAGQDAPQMNLTGMTLPTANISDAIAQGRVVRVLGKDIMVEDKKILPDQLTQVFLDMKKDHPEDSIIIQADKKLSFSQLNPIMLAAAQAGVEKFQFAVMPAGDSLKNTSNLMNQ